MDTWDELVAAKANGWIAVGIITQGNDSWPWAAGPYATKRDAHNARVRMRGKFKRDIRNHELDTGTTAKFFVRPLWKSTN